tara:strand:+ start:383 stop:1462 length:1080 start_codon:yes stop_codon:yes gene_type:complete
MIRIIVTFLLLSFLISCNPSDDEEVNEVSKRTYSWKMVTAWPPNSPINQESVEQFAKDVAIMSRGRLKIKVFAGGELVPPSQAFDAVSQGGVQMAHTASYYWAGKVPAAQFMTVVPFGLTHKGAWSWIYAGGGLALWQELYEPFGIVPFPMGNTGIQMGGWFNKKINSLDDLKGLKIRMPGLGGKVLAKAGANPVNIDPGELYMAVERGVIDATEWVGPVFDKRQGLDEVAKYYYFPGWHEPGSQLELIINRDAWKLLEPDLKLIVETAAAKASLDIFAQSELQNTAAFLEMQADNSIEILEFPESVLTELRRLTALVIEEEASADTDFSKIFEAYRAFEEDYQAYRSVTEIPYRKTFE